MVIDSENYTFNKEWLDGVAANAIEKLDKLKQTGDIELMHMQADTILCEVLKAMDFDDVVDAWEDVDRWYS
jgi:hypothetical protein